MGGVAIDVLRTSANIVPNYIISWEGIVIFPKTMKTLYVTSKKFQHTLYNLIEVIIVFSSCAFIDI